MNTLDKATVERIEKDATAFAWDEIKDTGTTQYTYRRLLIEKGYEKGATAEALRYKECVDALERIVVGRTSDNMADRLSDTQMARIAQKALNNLK